MWLGAIFWFLLMLIFDEDAGCSGAGCLGVISISVLLGAAGNWLWHWDPCWVDFVRVLRMGLAVVMFVVLAKVVRICLERRFSSQFGEIVVQSKACKYCAWKLALALTIFLSVSLYCYQRQSFAEELEADIEQSAALMNSSVLEEEKIRQTKWRLSICDPEKVDQQIEYKDVVEAHPEGTILWYYAQALEERPAVGQSTAVQRSGCTPRECLNDEKWDIKNMLRKWGYVDKILEKIPDTYQGKFQPQIQTLKQQSAAEQQRLSARQKVVKAEYDRLTEQAKRTRKC